MSSPDGPDFSDRPLLEVIAHLRARIEAGDARMWIRVADPDRGAGHWPGTRVDGGDDRTTWHRPWRTWVDLAERLRLRMSTPRVVGDGTVWISLSRLGPAARWGHEGDDASERYGVSSAFASIDKAEDPAFVIDLDEALGRGELPARPRILDLGINRGDEVALMLALRPSWRDASWFGVDHSASALAHARDRFADLDLQLREADLGKPDQLDLPRFDLVVSIGTLHSPGVDDRAVLRRVVQDWLTPTGVAIFGFPNCRYADGEVEYGARLKNLREPELSLLLKDVSFFRRYLQQHRRRVFVTGRYEVLVTAIPIGSRRPSDERV